MSNLPGNTLNEIKMFLAQAEAHYRDMQVLQAAKRYTTGCAYCAHQTLEMSLKALCLALGVEILKTHSLKKLADLCGVKVESNRIAVYRCLTWRGSRLTWRGQYLMWGGKFDTIQLDNYAGGRRYDVENPEDTGIDFSDLVANVEKDYIAIRQRIAEVLPIPLPSNPIIPRSKQICLSSVAGGKSFPMPK